MSSVTCKVVISKQPSFLTPCFYFFYIEYNGQIVENNTLRLIKINYQIKKVNRTA